MSIKNRVQKLEAKKNPELLNVILKVWDRDKPLPEPRISGSVLVSYQYDDAPKDKAM
jgi:hypothetical protein